MDGFTYRHLMQDLTMLLIAGSYGWFHLPPSNARPHHVQDVASEAEESCPGGKTHIYNGFMLAVNRTS